MRGVNLTDSAPRTHRNGLDAGDCRCPWCRQTVSRDELIEIQVRQDELVFEIEERVKSRLITERDAEIERVRQEAATAVEAAEQAMTKREAAIRREATVTASAALAPKLAKAEQEKKAVEQQIKTLKSSTETVIAARLAAQRETYEKATAGAVLTERAKYLGEKLKLEEQLQDMQRRLQAKTAHQLGEPAEVDLYTALEAAFPDDRISRVVKGVKGPDVIVEVVTQGDVVGKIVLDSKNHARWSHKFTSKLRSDQLAEGADFAILSSSVFPAGAQQLFLQDNVIVASPQRVVVLVHLLRRQIVENFRLKLSASDRNEKADRIYAFILSPTYADMLDGLLKRLGELDALHEAEVKDHLTTWKKRTGLTEIIRAVVGDFSAAVAAIIAGELQ